MHHAHTPPSTLHICTMYVRTLQPTSHTDRPTDIIIGSDTDASTGKLPHHTDASTGKPPHRELCAYDVALVPEALELIRHGALAHTCQLRIRHTLAASSSSHVSLGLGQHLGEGRAGGRGQAGRGGCKNTVRQARQVRGRTHWLVVPVLVGKTDLQYITWWWVAQACSTSGEWLHLHALPAHSSTCPPACQLHPTGLRVARSG